MFQESRGVVFVYKGAQILRLFKSEQYWARDLGRLLSKSEHWSSRLQRSFFFIEHAGELRIIILVEEKK